MYNQPAKNAVNIKNNKIDAQSWLIAFPLSENNKYRLEISENKIKGVANIMYLFV
jgi:hypothetical protein